jgi:hypothetical protein
VDFRFYGVEYYLSEPRTLSALREHPPKVRKTLSGDYRWPVLDDSRGLAGEGGEQATARGVGEATSGDQRGQESDGGSEAGREFYFPGF